jgi:hypothetical protein
MSSALMKSWKLRSFSMALLGNFLLTVSTTSVLMATKRFDLLIFVALGTAASLAIGVGLNSPNPKYSYNILLFGIAGSVLAVQVAVAAIAFSDITSIIYMALANISCYLVTIGAYRMAQIIPPLHIEKEMVTGVLGR